MALLVSLLAITAAAISIRTSPTPPGTWSESLYTTFAPAWSLLVLGAVTLLVTNSHPRVRILSASLLASVIGLITMQWGTTFGIRDGWIHLGHIRDGNYLISSRYPSFHTTIELLSTVTDIPESELIPFVSPIAVVLGVILLAAVAVRLTGSRQIAATAAITLMPAVIVDFNDRPIALAGVLTLTVGLLALSPLEDRIKRPAVIGTILISLLYHPLIGFLAVLLVGGVVVWSYVELKVDRTADMLGSSPTQLRALTSPMLLILISTAFALYFFYFRSIGTDLAARTVLSVLSTGGGEATSGGSTPLLYQITAHIQAAATMGAIVICSAFVAVVGWTLADRKSTDRFVAFVSMTAAGCLAAIFVAVDVFTPTGFGATRVLPLLPVLLVFGAIVGVCEIKAQSRRLATPILAIVLVVSLVVIFPSPLTGTFQQSSTPSDVDRTEWLVNHHGDNTVIEAENTYEIAHAKYGSSQVDDLASGDIWTYRSTNREEPYPWQVKTPAGGALIVDHDLTRLNADHDGVAWQAEELETNSSRVYTGGNSDVYVYNT